MTENELISKIRKLRQIKPRKDWVVLTKSQILGQESTFIFPFFKPAFAGLITIFVLFGLFGFSQNSLPGDLLYPIKKIAEKSQAVFVSEEEKPQYNLEMANKRLEELTKIAQTNQVRKLAPALEEYQASVSEAAKNLAKIVATTSDPTIIKKITEETKKLTKNKEKVESLGVAVGETKELKELEENIQVIIARQIETWKTQINSLSDELEIKKDLEELIKQAEESYLAEDWYLASQILEKIYLSYPQP